MWAHLNYSTQHTESLKLHFPSRSPPATILLNQLAAASFVLQSPTMGLQISNSSCFKCSGPPPQPEYQPNFRRRRHSRSASGRAAPPPRSLPPRSLGAVRAAWRLQGRIAVKTFLLYYASRQVFSSGRRLALASAVLRRGTCWPSSELRGNCRAAS